MPAFFLVFRFCMGLGLFVFSIVSPVHDTPFIRHLLVLFVKWAFWRLLLFLYHYSFFPFIFSVILFGLLWPD